MRSQKTCGGRISDTKIPSYIALNRRISKMSRESETGDELRSKIIENLKSLVEDDIDVIVTIASRQFKSADVIFLHTKFEGLYLKDGTLAGVKIKGLLSKDLEF